MERLRGVMGYYSKRVWDDRTHTSRAALPSDPERSCFNAYVPHLLKDWKLTVPYSTWRRVDAAVERCHRLKKLTIGREPVSEWLLDRSEALASSTIEGIHPSSRRVARAEAQLTLFGDPPKEAETQVLRNIAASKHAIQTGCAGRDLTVDGIREIHSVLMGDHDPIAGTIRERQNWVGGGALGTPMRARHVAPPPERVPDLMEDLVEYINSEADEDPVVRAGVAHAQFETIHPFSDGNGRTGRALIQFLLHRDGLVSGGALPISSALMLNKEQYFDSLNGCRAICEPDDPERSTRLLPWIEQFAEATSAAAVLKERLLGHIDALGERWKKAVVGSGMRHSGATLRLLRALPEHPVLTVNSIAGLLQMNKRTAQRAVNQLTALKILEQRSAGRRNRAFVCSDIMDAFAESVRQQPTTNLTLMPPPDDFDIEPRIAKHRMCGARTAQNTPCKHPRPRDGGSCPAGHKPRQ